MCDPIQGAEDLALTAIGQPELIPLATAGTDLAEGKGVGKSLLAGGEALAGQELAGAVGVGGGNSAFNDALGITGDNPAGTGLPDIGGAITSGVKGLEDFGTTALGGVKDELGLGTSSSATSSFTPDNLTSNLTFGGTQAPASAALASSGAVTPATSIGGLASQSIGDQATGSGIEGLSTSTPTGLGSVVSDAGNAGAFDFAGGASSAPATSAGGSVANIAKNVAGSTGSSTLSKIATLAPIGNLAYQAIEGPPKVPSSAAALAAGGAATAPLLDTEKTQLAEGSTGQLSASQQQMITNNVQQAQNQLIQQLASQGVTDFRNDSRYIQGMQSIQQQALAQQQQFINDAITNGISAGGAASGNIAKVAQEQIDQDKEFQDALSQAFGSLGSALGGTTNLRITA